MTKEERILKIKQAGVVGAGGAGFPTYKKLETRVHDIIANGAECEPLLSKDRESMVHEAEAMFCGLKIMQEITGAERITIALKEKNRDLADRFQELSKSYGYELFFYPNVYPAGDEYLLVYEITGKRIPPGGIPLQVGCVVDNNETIINIAHAMDDRPVTGKYITVTGAVTEPVTLHVPVGISYRQCVELAGGSTVSDPVILTGGAMMGGFETDFDLPVSKTLGGLIILPADHYLAKRKGQPQETYTRIGHGQCDQCSLCTELCFRYTMGYPIEPHKVMRTLQMTGEAKERNSLWAQYCCECNICSLIACPELLDPKNICVDAKQLLKDNQMSRTQGELDVLFRDVHPARRGREIPIDTVITRLGLKPYNRYATFREEPVTASEVCIPLDTHIGKPATPNVSEGDRVNKGQIVADVGNGDLGCPAHASIDGKVVAIDSRGIHISANA